MRRKLARNLAVGVSVIVTAVPTGASPAVAAGAGSCLTGDACFMNYQQGNYYYGYTSNDMDMRYESFNNGYVVGGNVQQGRNRDANYEYLCVYNYINGSSGSLWSTYVPYTGTTWKVIPRSTLSEESHSTVSAC